MPRTRADYDFIQQHPHPGDDPVVRLAHTNTIHADTDPDSVAVTATSGIYDEGRTGLTYGDLRALEVELGRFAADRTELQDKLASFTFTVDRDTPPPPWVAYVENADDQLLRGRGHHWLNITSLDPTCRVVRPWAELWDEQGPLVPLVPVGRRYEATEFGYRIVREEES